MNAPGKGCIPTGRNPEGMRRIVIGLDVETFGEVRARAVKARTSFAEEARLLITFGLETANAS